MNYRRDMMIFRVNSFFVFEIVTGQKPTAIVTEIAGTTRDVIESTINVNGYPVVLTDTAGIRRKGVENVVEEEGIRRSKREAGIADVILLVIDVRDVLRNIEASRTTGSYTTVCDQLLSYCDAYKKLLGVEELVRDTRCITIFNKIDLLDESLKQILQEVTECCPEFAFISCKTEAGIPQLLKSMCEHFDQM